jgi:hypothetical protein
MNELLKAIADWVDDFEAFFLAAQNDLNKKVRRVEASIYRGLIADVVPALKIEEGRIKNTLNNLAKANFIERVFDEVGRDEANDLVRDYAAYLIEISGKNAEYYYSIGIDRAKVDAIADSVGLIRRVIGIGEDGKLLQGGYLYRLATAETVREQVKQYVLTSIASGQSLKQFQSGLKGLVQSTDEVDGVLLSYWNNYAYDQFSRVREINNLHFKDEIGLKYFVYQGGLIRTSRKFCIKKNGNVFSEEEAIRDWPKDPDLIDKAHLSTYNPLIDRGRHNCRHFLMWISDEMANELKQRQ